MGTATIKFRAKVQRIEYSNGTFYEYINCPVLQRSHCDMAAFRSHPKYGGYANSDMFAGMLKHIRRELFGENGVLKIGNDYSGVTVDTSGFLAEITIVV